MRYFILGFVSGVVLLLNFSYLPAVQWCWLLFVVPVLVIYFPKQRLISGILGGFLWALLQATQVMLPEFPAHLQKKEILIEGKILTIPASYPHSTRFEFEPLIWNQQETPPDKIILSWYNNPPVLRAGEHWQLQVKLKRPHGMSNPGGRDRQMSLFRSGVTAVGYVRKSQLNNKKADADLSLHSLRQRLADHIATLLGDHAYKGLVLALVLGERSEITSQQWQTFTNTGTSHLIAISGLHIGLVSGFFYWLTGMLWRRSLQLCQWLPAQKAGAISALCTGFVYAAMAGFSVPTQRAMIMLAVVVCSLLVNRSFRRFDVLLIALFLVLLVNSLTVLSAGLWLSFAAVAVILWMIGPQYSNTIKATGSHTSSKINRWQWLRIQWFISLGLLPLTVFFFQQASLVSPATNLIAVPLAGFVIVPLLLFGVLVSLLSATLGSYLLDLPLKMLEYLNGFLMLMEQLPVATVSLPTPGLVVLLLSVVGVFLILSPAFAGSRALAPLLFLPLIINQPVLFTDEGSGGYFKVDVLDVGQGTAVVIHTTGHTMIYDTGPKYSDTFNAGDAVLVPYLKSQGITDIDLLMVSHSDRDHSGGMLAIINGFSPHKLLTPATDKKGFAEFDDCVKATSWQWDGVQFDVLHPAKGWVDGGNRDANNRSCVLRVSNANGSILLPADIEKKAEIELLHSGQSIGSTVLLAPHHGSETSSTAEFLDAVQPSIAIMTTGYLNRFDFPRKSILKRYVDRDIQLLNTADTGMISLTFSGRRDAGSYPQIERFRDKHPHFWHSARVNSQD